MGLDTLREMWERVPGDVMGRVKRRGFSQPLFLCDLIERNRYVNILEIGTFLGKTASLMAAATAPFGGRVETINISDAEIAEAKKLASLLEVSNIDFKVGDSLSVIPELSGPWDLVFIDGHHSYRHSMAEFNLVKDRMKDDSVIIFDDAGGVHCDSKGDGGVPRAVQESGAKLVKVGDCVLGIYETGSVSMDLTEEGWEL